MDTITTPDWVKHAVFYQIFPDRFARSGRGDQPSNLEPWDSDPTTYGYKGGDLWGVLERLDYLQELGVTALYFNPIFQSASNHRYHTHDYYRVDPLLGGDAAFEALLAECHRRGLRVVLDGVFNHASRGFFQFNDVLENGAASPWLDWFYIDDHAANAYDHSRPPGYQAWVGLHALPKFNTDNLQVREYLMQVGEYWIDRGIDGWRLDVPFEIKSAGFWAEFRQRIKARNPAAYIVGEVWGDSREWLQGDQFDGVMNYLFAAAAIAFTAGPRVRRDLVDDRSYAAWPGIDGRAYAARIAELLALYPWPIQLTQLNLLASHDTARFLSIADGDVASVELGTLLLFTFPGAPSIYYGDEIGLDGGRPDAWARKAFPWQDATRWNHALRHYHQALIAVRQSQPALQIGDYQRLAATPTVYAFRRTAGESTVITAVNVGDEAATITVPAPSAAPAVRFGRATLAPAGTEITLTLPGRSGAIIA